MARGLIWWLYVLLIGLLPNQVRGQVRCPENVSTVLVEVHEGRMYLCQDAKVLGSYSVALGRGGVGKRSYHDNKTPIGQYFLDTPRPSERFHLFIPIGYPTDEQRKQGFTGQDIGIHGPDRRFKWAGRLNTWFDWTQGCVAVAKDQEIDEVSQWLRRSGAKTVMIKV